MPKPRRRISLVCVKCGMTFTRIAKDVVDPNNSYCGKPCRQGRPPGNSAGVKIAYFNCEQCGKLFVRRIKQITKNAAHVVCSSKCRNDLRRTRPETIPCDHCGKMFVPSTSNYKRTIYHFCSLECRDTLPRRQWPARTLTHEQRERREQALRPVRTSHHKRRAKKHGSTINDFTARDWETMKAIHGNRCVYCGRKMKRLTMDHLTPVIKSGPHTKWNILPACQSCNSRKNKGNVLKPVQPLLL